jgi:hypothetical protein
VVSEHNSGGEELVEDVWLFSYGTLQNPAVQLALFGREVERVHDSLVGYSLGTVIITDPDVVRTSGSDAHPILRPGGVSDQVSGSALLLTSDELAAVDRYEVSDYVRTSVVLASGRSAYVYVQRPEDIK